MLARMLACLSPGCVTEIKLGCSCLSVTYDSVVLSAGSGGAKDSLGKFREESRTQLSPPL